MTTFVGHYKKVKLTNKNCYQKSSHSLLLHLLDAWFIAGCHGLAHDGKRIGVRHRAHGRGSQPGQAKQSRDPAHGYDDQQVQMKARPLYQHPLLFTHNEPEGKRHRQTRNLLSNIPHILITYL